MKKLQPVISILWILSLISFALPSGAAKAAGAIYYVKADATGSNNGTSWANAYTSLQSPIARSVSGDEIWVAAGTYKPTTSIYRSVSFKLKEGISIYGGFAGTETLRSQRNWKTNVTILSGDIGAPNVLTDNSYHVVDVSSVASVLDGFTITKGNANGNVASFGRGGGILSENGRFHLENLIVTQNNALGSGGGIMNDGTHDAIMLNVVLENNTAENGGGISNLNSSYTLSLVTFRNNTAASSGGGLENIAIDATSYPIFNDVIFINNKASDGGAMINGSHMTYDDSSADASPSFTNATFSGNSATHNGGAVFNYGDITRGAPSFTNVTFNGNSAENGGALYNQTVGYPILTNVTITGNTATISGGALYTTNSPITLIHITASGNTSADGCGVNTNSGLTSIENSILWANGNQFCPSDGYQHQIKNSIIQGGCPTSANCINVVNADPLLKPLANNGGFTKTMALDVNSPALDIAGDVSTCAATDQRGTARPQGPGCDAGAYEKGQASATVSSEAANDGWILNGQQKMDSKSPFFYVGDNEGNHQYVSIVSFNTAKLALPAGAVISGARLKLKSQSSVAQNLSAYYALGSLIFDIRRGPFSDDPALQLRDVNAVASKDNLGSITKVPVNGLYIKTWTRSIAPYIPLNGRTQFRLRMETAINSNNIADALTLYSGEAAAADRPQLIVYYYLP